MRLPSRLSISPLSGVALAALVSLPLLVGADPADEAIAPIHEGVAQTAQTGVAQTTESVPTDASTTSQPPAARASLEEIVITARKREESLQDAPIAVTAFTATDLQDQDIRRIQNITDNVPNLNFGSAIGTSQAAAISLRGVGNGDPISSDDPGVGVYVDGVYLARAQGALFTVSDIERVEVLRGPQGTLFGKNTIGGAINVITRKPMLDEFSSSAEVRFGNYDRFDSRLSVNVPLVSEMAAARLSFASATRDAFFKNKGPGSDPGDDKLLAFRAQIMALPSDNVEALFSFEHSLEDRQPAGAKCKVTNRLPAGTPPGTPQPGSEFQGPPSAAIFFSNPLNPIPLLEACDEDAGRDFRSIASDLSIQEEDLKTFATTGTLTWDVGDNLTIKSVSAWRRQEVRMARDLDGTAINFFNTANGTQSRVQQDQISQELQLSGLGLDGRLSWVGGLYFFSEKSYDQGPQGALAFPSNLTVPFFDDAGNVTSTLTLPSVAQKQRLKVNNLSYAAYGQGAYDLSDQLSLTLGLRLTHERKRTRRDDVCLGFGLTGGTLCPGAGALAFAFEGSIRSSEISPMINLKYQINDDTQVYGTVSRGFKSGGFNGRADGDNLTDPVDDEKLTSYEVGLKSTLLDNRLVVNAAAFWSIYDNIQLSSPRGNAETQQLEVITLNAGRAEIKGVELEVRAYPLDGLELTSSIGVTNARYTEFDSNPDPIRPDKPVDNRLPGTPNYTMNFAAAYTMPLGDLGNLRLRADWAHIGSSAVDINDSGPLNVGKHGELDAQIALALADGVTEIVLFGSNLLDREYFANGIDFGNSFGVAIRYPNDPRTYGIEIRRSF